MEVGHAPFLQCIQIVLEFGVRVGVTIRELVSVIIFVEHEIERHYIVLTVFRTAIIVNLSGRQTMPAKEVDYFR